IDDLRDIKKRFEKIDAEKKFILTTEKDAIRLTKFKTELESMPVYVIPIRHYFLFNEEEKFINNVVKFIETFKTSSENSKIEVNSTDAELSEDKLHEN
ncbi:MAG TPA: hypothetical protein VGG71_12680, partial [Chitinophagaceae bacterium]